MEPVVPTPSTGGELLLDLAHDVTAPGTARAAVREALLAWGMGRLLERVLLVVSELVTNAVRYGRSPISLALISEDSGVRIRVHDAAWDLGPRRRNPDDTEEQGRGLNIIATLTGGVQVEQGPDDGKVVTAVVR